MLWRMARTLSHRWLAVAWVLLATTAGVQSQEPTPYGKGVVRAEPVSITALLADPDKFLGQTIQVEGKITDVCPMRGCWIKIADPQGQTIRYKVKDGEIVFPVDSKGHHVLAEGVLAKQELDHEQAIAYARHLAEERGEPFDPASVKGPQTLYQIHGAGAVVD
jgi:hypothetical protein